MARWKQEKVTQVMIDEDKREVNIKTVKDKESLRFKEEREAKKKIVADFKEKKEQERMKELQQEELHNKEKMHLTEEQKCRIA